MQQRIREAFAEKSKDVQLIGTVEVDEYIGGLEKLTQIQETSCRTWWNGQVTVVGVKDRETKIVRTQVIDDCKFILNP